MLSATLRSDGSKHLRQWGLVRRAGGWEVQGLALVKKRQVDGVELQALGVGGCGGLNEHTPHGQAQGLPKWTKGLVQLEEHVADCFGKMRTDRLTGNAVRSL